MTHQTRACLWQKKCGDGQQQIPDLNAIYNSIVNKIPVGEVELVHGRLKALVVQYKDATVLFQSSNCQNLNCRWIAIGLKQTKAVHVVEGV